MSKAFTKEDDGGEPDAVIARRMPLPSGTPNYVTARGLALLQAELAELEAERVALDATGDDARRSARVRLGVRISDVAARIASAVPIAPPLHEPEQIRFGATVRIRREDGSERVYQVVGVDEADPKQGRIAFVAPLARALVGQRVGDSVRFQSPRGVEELEILHVDHARGEPPACPRSPKGG
jgi:transcription elongation factor GreB